MKVACDIPADDQELWTHQQLHRAFSLPQFQEGAGRDVAKRVMGEFFQRVAAHADGFARMAEDNLAGLSDSELFVRAVMEMTSVDPMLTTRERLKLKGQLRFAELLKNAGGTYSLQEVADLLGTSPAATRKRRDRGNLLAIKIRGHYRYPAWQFTEAGDVIPGIPEVLSGMTDSDAASQIRFFLTPLSELEGQRPIDWLQEGKPLEPVLRIAEGFEHQGAR